MMSWLQRKALPRARPDDAAKREERLVDVLSLALFGQINLLALSSLGALTTSQVDEVQFPSALHHGAVSCYYLGGVYF